MSQSSIIHPYSTAYFPPVPVLNIELSAPEIDDWHGPFTAMIDSGADYDYHANVNR